MLCIHTSLSFHACRSAFHVGLPAAAVRGTTRSPASAVVMNVNVDMLRAELAKAQKARGEAKTQIEMINAQEAVDALFDRIDRQKLLDAPSVATLEAPIKSKPSGPWGTTAEEDQAIIDRILAAAGKKKGLKIKESFEQIEVHES